MSYVAWFWICFDALVALIIAIGLYKWFGERK
jgi:hypothetical protein